MPNHKMITKLYLLKYPFLFIFLASCIGTDIVEQELVPARVAITAKADSIRIGESYQFQAQYFDDLGNIVDADITWASTDPAVISIEGSGLATANSAGNVTISAMANGTTDMVMVNAGENTTTSQQQRTGSFRGNRDYVVSGTFTLSNASGGLELSFSDDFSTTNGPGLFVYLTNSESSTSGGEELGALKSNNGAQTYEVSDEIQMGTYDYVLIYCKPFGVAFGIGKFDE